MINLNVKLPDDVQIFLKTQAIKKKLKLRDYVISIFRKEMEHESYKI